jgi:hypothetical protein
VVNLHAIFILYGKRSEVDLLIRDMEAQKHVLQLYKKEKEEVKEKQQIWIQGQVRLLPFGIYEYIFPREDVDLVLNTLNFDGDYDKYINPLKKFIIRNIIKCEKIPEYNKDKKLLWIKDNVAVIPIGIKKDDDIIDTSPFYKGWHHEGI